MHGLFRVGSNISAVILFLVLCQELRTYLYFHGGVDREVGESRLSRRHVSLRVGRSRLEDDLRKMSKGGIAKMS